MKKSIVILSILVIISGLFIYCQKRTGLTAKSLAKIRSRIESDEVFEKEEPFTEREFKPLLNGKWIGNAVSYGCYRKGQAPGKTGPTEDEILEDLIIISDHWNLIRVYNADDDTERILDLIRKNNLPIRVMMGVWLENETSDPVKKEANLTNVLRCIELADKYRNIIAAVNVGNETQVFWSWHKMNQDDLIKYIRAVRKYTSVPVTTADDYNFWNKEESKAVAEEIDFIVTHIYPLWNGKTLETSIDWLDENIQIVQNNHPEKNIVLGEIGWATKYNPAKKGPGEQGTLIKGEVSLEAQERFLKDLDYWIENNEMVTFLFEAFDEPWKGGGENTSPDEIEKNWGVFYENRLPKESFDNFLKHKNKDN